ncbi:MAG: hydantoinase B/oxoprolinase family protein [Chloroflexi bacterium]|nr:hydantoinase B/oxoprolinase family protein [Chloroflexota bacterium]
MDKLDPVTFEVIRHRLWAINDEAGTTIKLISGSPVANEAYDFNTGILSASGDMVIMGIYISSHACVQGEVIKHVLEEYQENPGINEGDVFLCNDPYYGALHQPDITVVAPIHWQGKLMGWCGCTLHFIDVGGPVSGGWAVGAASVHDEAPVMPPFKLVEGGVLRKDLEKLVVRRSRFPEIFSLDLRSQLAAINVTRERFRKLVEAYGPDAVEATIDGIIDYVDARFRSRLKDLPDGIYRHTAYIEHDGLQDKVYACPLTLTKRDDKLVLDYTEASAQAPGLINACVGGLKGAVLSFALPMLCYDIPWCPAAVLRSLEFRTKPGTIVDATWPAGVSSATAAALWAARVDVNVCLARMMAASPKYRDHVMSTWSGAFAIWTFDAQGRQGGRVGGMAMDLLGGAGARSDRDGINTGGILSSLTLSVGNVETYEFLYPLLYLYRHELADSGGAGMFRGGVAGASALAPYGTSAPMSIVAFTHGMEQPPSAGVSGAYPGGTGQYHLKRKTNAARLLGQGRLPQDMEELEGQTEPVPPKTRSYLGTEDVMQTTQPGGGGYGDPLERAPELVAEDVRNGLVSLRAAEHVYGVMMSRRLKVGPKSTQKRRQAIRAERQKHSAPGTAPELPQGEAEFLKPMSYYLDIVRKEGRAYVRCHKCQRIVAPADLNYKNYLPVGEFTADRGSIGLAPGMRNDRFVLREFYCPGCWTMLETEVNLKDSPFIWDVQLEV